MPIMTGISLQPTRHHGGGFHAPSPIGIVCHRTEGSFSGVLSGFLKGPKSVDFLLGKSPGNAAQLVDTAKVAYHVGPGANQLFIGIEFESVAARQGYAHRTDPLVNADPLTPYHIDMDRRVINWICKTHKIPLRGPPSVADMAACQGKYSGLLNHSSLNHFFPTTHGDALRTGDWNALLQVTGQLGDFPKGRSTET